MDTHFIRFHVSACHIFLQNSSQVNQFILEKKRVTTTLPAEEADLKNLDLTAERNLNHMFYVSLTYCCKYLVNGLSLSSVRVYKQQ